MAMQIALGSVMFFFDPLYDTESQLASRVQSFFAGILNRECGIRHVAE